MQEYLDRIGFDGPVTVDLETLRALQAAHMSTVPFENLSVWRGERVSTGTDWSIPKIVERGQGGWCFELNGAFAVLLESLGFTVHRLGAAVLLDGPNQVVDHICLEVVLDQPYLVDVGFGESFTRPLLLNDRNPQDGGIGRFQFFDSAQGLTLTRLEDDVPAPQYRFRRVAHTMSDFDEASTRLQEDKTLHWSTKPFATKLIDGGPERVTLLKDRLKFISGEETTETPVSPDRWEEELQARFRP